MSYVSDFLKISGVLERFQEHSQIDPGPDTWDGRKDVAALDECERR